MKLFKCAVAGILAAAMVLTMASCRKKDEVMASLGEYKIHAGVYLAIVMQAKVAAQNKVDETLQASGAEAADNIDYTKQKIEDQDYNTWVKNEIKRICAQYLYVEKQFADEKLSIADKKDQIDYMSYIDWFGDQNSGQPGRGSLYEKNGIAQKSQRALIENTVKMSVMFLSRYGKGGTMAVPEAEVKEAFKANFLLLNALTDSTSKPAETEGGTSTPMTDDEKAKVKSQLDGYATRLGKGEAFSKIQEDFQEVKEKEAEANNPSSDTGSSAGSSTAASSLEASSAAASADASSGAASSEAPKAQDPDAILFSGHEKANPSPYYEKFKDLEVGKPTVMELTDDQMYVLALRRDVLADPYYFDQNYDTVLNILKEEEFMNFLKTESAKLTVVYNENAITFYNPKKVKLVEASSAAQ